MNRKSNTIKITQAKAIAMATSVLKSAGVDTTGLLQGEAFKRERTIDEVFQIALKEHWSQKRFKDSGWYREVVKNYANHIRNELGGIPISELSALQIRLWHKHFGTRHIAANRSLELLSKLFIFAQEKEWLLQAHNPCRLVKAHKERKRKRFATKEEIKKICEILDREAQKIRQKRKVIFIYMLMFTGARPRDIERAKWDMLFLHDGYGVLTFKGKTTNETGEEEQIILPLQVLRMIQGINRFNDSILGIKCPVAFWRKIRNEAGCPDLWIRDLRRTFATIGLSNGVGHGVIGELLNHKSAQTTNIYAKLMTEKKVESVKNIADVISSIKEKGKDFVKCGICEEKTHYEFRYEIEDNFIAWHSIEYKPGRMAKWVCPKCYKLKHKLDPITGNKLWEKVSGFKYEKITKGGGK